MFRFNLQRITLLATVVFVSSFMLFPESPLQSSFYSRVYAASIICESGLFCNGTNGDDNMMGTETADEIVGLDGDDRISGGSSGDELRGSNGNDILSGGSGNDDIFGDSGNDKLSGGSGDDEFTGGDGADMFNCGSGDNDQIIDFNEGEGDTKSNDCEIF